MYIIIIGAGDIGTPLIDIATQSGNEVVVIERDEKRANQAADQFDCLVLNADATTKEILADAGAERADALISTTDQDATNVMTCLLAKEFEVPAILSVVHNPEHMGLFEQIGVNTMENPQQLIAEYLYRAVARPAIVDYMRIGEEAEVFEIRVTEDAPVAGKTLEEAVQTDILTGDMLVVAIERQGNDHPITPRGNTTIKEGDLLTVYSSVGADPEITDIFGHYEDHIE
ncbi:TrkA family potassium uptake protein [Haloferax mediterranei ATCC 33500]|uniref:Potassium transporter Trk n=1 Tax=Haloferax mediterranei (strain ATCC 33500 / DSM 1411 / JCM 8866 / NBRC 14739 / NCIMB 2177 / R-4) TaxID=523841 RepID=I3R0Q1_HALMT|nr:TrkA family potassium uptake protein [Haloferax mediterranei]AFK17811.1 Trk potassium uptake system protein [Haloferax mediterranei ATCC 33500]AHZ22763.1 potassium transporter Trk [Haloferax mediterranei ATCC 33500]EMA02917.1 Trk potassium uptake system protein [Haloferax mediterranei ATCC 33500]MDX5987900.1 TrkA family potassium uptake protein [Haloferax mediterranei ATCC 33500]QCQ74374.1 TrkA family potassium uptake protein [Haloferax mediterranei ATCC 33500]